MDVIHTSDDSDTHNKEQSIELSRLAIIGYINRSVPLCVLIEIADAHGINYNEADWNKPNFGHHLMEKIIQTPISIINNLNNASQLSYIVRFVNKHRSWPQKKLIQAYNFIIKFTDNDDPLNKIPIDFIAGSQTPENPFSINACILYKTCLHYHLNVNVRTTINQMAYAIRLLRNNIESVMRQAKLFVERDAKRIDLINILITSPHEIKDFDDMPVSEVIDYNVIPKINESYDLFLNIHNSLSDIRILQQKFEPTTHAGFVALAAINYSIDISKARNTSREYKLLQLTGGNGYDPGDKWIIYWYHRNPGMFDLSITFNPLFPVNYYNKTRLVDMAKYQGYTDGDILNTDPYELLQLAHVSETFYQGEYPTMKSKETSINLEDVNDIPYGELLCYGQIEIVLRPISITELIDTFNANENFSSPFQCDTVFTPTVINKLKNILRLAIGPVPSIALSQETIQLRATLLELINYIQLKTMSSDEPTRQFLTSYKNTDQKTKFLIKNTLGCLLNIGMAMRGWLGGGDLPVSHAPVPPEKQGLVSIKVTEFIASFESMCRSLGKIGSQIKFLPIVLYKDGQYQISNDHNQGYTIEDRITIVKQGDKSGNVASCIRLSSNWVCSSAHKYITSLGLPAPFDIFKLSYIS